MTERQAVPWRDARSHTLSKLVAKTRLGLITDMDGTLSPIVPRPEDARVTPRNRELLSALADKLPLVAIVSGRAVADLRARVGLPHLTYVGNHGLERWEDGRIKLAGAVESFRPKLEDALRELRARRVTGMLIEDKGATISAHYRLTDNPDTAASTIRAFAEEIAAQQGLDLFQGRMVFELRPPTKINKGTTFRDLIQEHALEAAVYLGDDTTDVDALRMARVLRRENVCYTLGIGVESVDMPLAVSEEADLLAAEVADVEAFLGWLLQARQAAAQSD